MFTTATTRKDLSAFSYIEYIVMPYDSSQSYKNTPGNSLYPVFASQIILHTFSTQKASNRTKSHSDLYHYAS